MSPVKCAPWAITQLRLDGITILPQVVAQTDLLPNRLLTLWPYTNISAPYVFWGNRYILLKANEQPPFKIGFPNPRGWLGYWIDGTLFIKRAVYLHEAVYADFGSSSECYCNNRFIELETLGPVITLAPGNFVDHTETWELFDCGDIPKDEDAVQDIVERIGLE